MPKTPPKAMTAGMAEPLTCLRGIGPKRAHLLALRELKTLLDLLFFLPARYEDRRRCRSPGRAAEEEAAWYRGEVLFGGEVRYPRSGKRLFRIVIQDPHGRLELVWFHYRAAYLQAWTRRGRPVLAYGRPVRSGPKWQIIHPEMAAPEDVKFEVTPIYPAVQGIPPAVLRSLIRQALDRASVIEDAVPRPILEKSALPGLKQALLQIHAPPPDMPVRLLQEQRSPGHRRLVFDRFFTVMLQISFRKLRRGRDAGPLFRIPRGGCAALAAALPFPLTPDQGRALEDIAADVQSGRRMNRLIQGDVGCGKTVVAALAASIAVRNGWQAAVMVPTQVLARQHYETFCALSKRLGFKTLLMTGSMGASERARAQEALVQGKKNVVVGTHALIQEGVEFSRLGLAVVDEQHRFGVKQRARLDRKGAGIHLLVMSATPIPRSLALTIHGDLDISTIRTAPRGRKPVTTRIVGPEDKQVVYRMFQKTLEAGQQALIVVPVISATEEGDLKNAEEMYAKTRRLFSPPYRVGLLHGRLPGEQKERICAAFRRGQIQLLVGTSVIEVGVHAPGATLMLVEHPERFGLAQLHQLRGRVGRGSVPGRCVLMLGDGVSPQARNRLELLARTSDGFEIARQDLRLRGHGQFTGVRQTGHGEVDLDEIAREPGLFEAARQAAEDLLADDPELARPEHRPLRLQLLQEPAAPLDPSRPSEQR